MNLNDFKIALRHLNRQRFYSITNILGLSIGLGSVLLLFIYISSELSYDQFHSKKDELFRLNKYVESTEGRAKNAESAGLIGPGIVNEFPEVEAAIRIRNLGTNLIRYEETSVFLEDVLYADKNFFEYFDFKLVRGEASQVLSNSSNIVLTESAAVALFGNLDVVGKTITGPRSANFTVTGLAKNPPKNSHIQFGALISWETTVPNTGRLPTEWMNNWHSHGITTYIALNAGTDVNSVHQKLESFVDRNVPVGKKRYEFYLQPFTEIHLGSADIISDDSGPGYELINSLSLVAILILLISLINYVNISTSKSSLRQVEIGIRKVIGAPKKQLVFQFLVESFILIVLSGLTAIFLVWWVLPLFNEFVGADLNMGSLNGRVIGVYLFLLVAVSFCAGIYPALIVSSFQPLSIIQASGNRNAIARRTRFVLTVFQFVISAVIISVTITVRSQVDYIQSKDLGYQGENVLTLRMTRSLYQNYEAFSNLLDSNPNVLSYVRSQQTPTYGNLRNTISIDGLDTEKLKVRDFRVDHDFLETYQIELKEGRSFNVLNRTDSSAILINETLRSGMGGGDVVGRKISLMGKEYNIIGVIKDFHFKSLHEPIEPMVAHLYDQLNLINVRYAKGKEEEVISFLNTSWLRFEEIMPFSIERSKEQLASLYHEEHSLSKAVLMFSIISILISCLGLYGAVSAIAQTKLREIGIRKVLGAREVNLMYLVNQSFIKVVFTSFVIALPISFKIAETWLEGYAYRIALGVLPFILTLILITAIALVTVSFETWRAIKSNPIDVLRDN